MIDHSSCLHPSTPSGRAKCRRARANGTAQVGQEAGHTSGGGTRQLTSPTHKERNRGKTPRDRDMQCDICGVEKILYRGTDPLTGILLTVGEDCLYYIKRSNDLVALP